MENTQDYRRHLRRIEYGDERDPKMRDFLISISPLTNAKAIEKPMFIIQGLNDPRVPVTESRQIVESVRSNGHKVWYVCARDEGHGFKKKINADSQAYIEVLFLEEFVCST